MNKYFGLSTELISLVAQEIISRIDDYEDCELFNLADEMFNNDYYIIGINQAKEFIAEYIDDMFVLNEYINNLYGEELTFKDPEAIVSTVMFLTAGMIIGELNVEKYDTKLIKKELERLL